MNYKFSIVEFVTPATFQHCISKDSTSSSSKRDDRESTTTTSTTNNTPKKRGRPPKNKNERKESEMIVTSTQIMEQVQKKVTFVINHHLVTDCKKRKLTSESNIEKNSLAPMITLPQTMNEQSTTQRKKIVRTSISIKELLN